MNSINQMQYYEQSNNNPDYQLKLTQQGSLESDQIITDQNSVNQLNSSSSRKHLITNRNWGQQEIDDFFDNFNQYLLIKYGNQNPIKSKYQYNCRLIDIFDKIRQQESEQKKMNMKMEQNKSSSRIPHESRQSNISSPNSQNEMNKNNIYQQLNTETNENFNQNDFTNQPQLNLQSIRRIRTQSCDIDESVAKQFNLQQLILLQQQQQQNITQQNNNNQGTQALNKFIKKINIENQYPNLIQEKRIPSSQQNTYFDSVQQQQQNNCNQNSYNPIPHIPSKNIYQSLNCNPLFLQKGKKRSVTINSNQTSINQYTNNESNNNNYCNIQNNYQSNKENIDPNSIQQYCNQEIENTQEYLKKRIENIQANVKNSKADFMKRINTNINGNQKSSQLQTSNTEGSQQTQSKLENCHKNQNIQNPISHLSNNYVNIDCNQNRQQPINYQADEHINRNHLNNKFRAFASRKSVVERANNQISEQANSNHPLADQLRERVIKQWDMNKENIFIPQQNFMNNRNQNIPKQFILQTQQQQQYNVQQQQYNNQQKSKNTQLQYNNLQYQQNILQQQQQQQQFSFTNNQQPQNQQQFKSIKRIY